jgi:hypothetical protein
VSKEEVERERSDATQPAARAMRVAHNEVAAKVKR